MAVERFEQQTALVVMRPLVERADGCNAFKGGWRQLRRATFARRRSSVHAADGWMDNIAGLRSKDNAQQQRATMLSEPSRSSVLLACLTLEQTRSTAAEC